MLQKLGDLVLSCWTQCVYIIEEKPYHDTVILSVCVRVYGVCMFICVPLRPSSAQDHAVSYQVNGDNCV